MKIHVAPLTVRVTLSTRNVRQIVKCTQGRTAGAPVVETLCIQTVPRIVPGTGVRTPDAPRTVSRIRSKCDVPPTVQGLLEKTRDAPVLNTPSTTTAPPTVRCSAVKTRAAPAQKILSTVTAPLNAIKTRGWTLGARALNSLSIKTAWTATCFGEKTRDVPVTRTPSTKIVPKIAKSSEGKTQGVRAQRIHFIRTARRTAL